MLRDRRHDPCLCPKASYAVLACFFCSPPWGARRGAGRRGGTRPRGVRGGDSAVVEEFGLRLEAAQEEKAFLLDLGGPKRRGVLAGGVNSLKEDETPRPEWVGSFEAFACVGDELVVFEREPP